MAYPRVRLPWELQEEILTRLPPKVLVRFRTVFKQWNSLFNDRSFIYNHLSLSRPHSCFVNYPRHWEKGTELWNPWFKQVKWIKLAVDKHFDVFGLGYDNSRHEKVYNMLGYMRSLPKVQINGYLLKVVDQVYKIFDYFTSPPEDQRNEYPRRVAIYECASQTLRFIDTPDEEDKLVRIDLLLVFFPKGHMFLWMEICIGFACNRQTREYFIQSFDFSREIFKPVCLLPFQESPSCDEHVLAIEIWVTKRKIDDREEVVWIKLMTLTATYLPTVFNKLYGVSYFIYDNETRNPCVYIVKGDTCNKIQIGSDSFASKVTWKL
ncbi:hypothetical protein N665_0505s0022 [Sinapis alba]|nr:hypothetical protein N665_0505s0022 [Sinapis alba]